MKSPTVVLLGTPGGFTAATLHGLLDAGRPPRALVLRDRARPAPVHPRAIHEAPADPASHLAARHGIAVERVADVNAPASVAHVSALGPDVLLVACLDQRVGRPLREAAAWASLNVHPSLLPAHRGPQPVFWQLRAGARHLGVSVHALADALDAGPVLAQARIAVEPGARLGALEAALARLGGRIAADLVAGGRPAAGTAQDPAAASADPAPAEADLALDPGWSSRRAFTFARATGAHHPLTVAGTRLVVTEALGHDDAATLDVPFRAAGGLLEVRFSPGVLRARGTLGGGAPRSRTLASG